MPLVAPAGVAGAAGVAGVAAELTAEACTRAAKTRDWLKTRWALGLRQELKRRHASTVGTTAAQPLLSRAWSGPDPGGSARGGQAAEPQRQRVAIFDKLLGGSTVGSAANFKS
jgi:hypothetical protein